MGTLAARVDRRVRPHVRRRSGGSPGAVSRAGLAAHRLRHLAGRPVLVRRAQADHGDPVDREAEGEDPGGDRPGSARVAPGAAGPRAGRAAPRARVGPRRSEGGRDMSAGASDGGPTVSRDPALLAPVFRAAVERAIADCQARQLDAYVSQGVRSPGLQALYYARGRTIVPPTKPVTNAPTNLQSWHGYGLAVDVISKSKGWDQPEEWFTRVAESFAKFGCRWGGGGKQRALPHFPGGRRP